MSLDRRTRLIAAVLLTVVLALLSSGAVLSALSGGLAVDMRLHYLPAADAVLHGEPVYSLAAAAEGHAYIYAPQVAFLLTPLTLVPSDVAALLVLVLSAALMAGTLAVLGVRDPLCYLAVFVWAPTWQEFDMGSITPALAFAVALVWRYRDRTWPPALALAAAVPAKLFLWPMFVWTLATRRLRVTLYALAIGSVVTLGAWSVIGFQGLGNYPRMLQLLEDANATRGYSFIGMTGSETAGRLLMLLVGGSLLVGCVALASRGDERSAFVLTLATSFALTPIVWMHYLIILTVPLAMTRPRFGVLWLLPLLLWIGPSSFGQDAAPRFMPLFVAAIIVAASTMPRAPSAHSLVPQRELRDASGYVR